MKQTFRSGSWWISLILVLVGIGSSAYLTILHYSILKSGFSGKTFCNISPYLNCDVVLLSEYSSLGTIPLAGLGLLFYLYLLGALFWGRIDKESAGRMLTLPYLLVIFSFGLSLLLAYLSLFQIGALCIFCTTMYVVNLLLLIFLIRTIGMNLSEWIKNFSQISWVKSLAYLGLVFIVGGIIFHTNHKQFAKDISQEQLTAYLNGFLKQPAQTIDISNRPIWGNPNAKITVVEFSDFECPYCKRAAFTLKPMLSKYQDKVKLVFMHYPLDSSCNTLMQRALHQNACSTAFASYCAGKQGKFWEYHDMAFERQPKFHQASLENMAKKLKLNLDQFKTCMASQETKDFIGADIEEGIKIKLRGTPAVFVNGRPFSPWMSRKAWKQLIEKLERGTGAGRV